MLKARYPVLSIKSARSGLEALEIAINGDPTLVLSTVRIPGINGLDLSRRLKERLGSKVKVVLMTNENVNLLPQENVDGVLPRPFALDALYKQINCFLKLDDELCIPARSE